MFFTIISVNAVELDSQTELSSIYNESQLLTAPLNPAFLEYQEALEQSQNDVSGADDLISLSNLVLSGSQSNLLFSNENESSDIFTHSTGLIPSPVDLSYLSPVSMDSLLADDTIRTSGLELSGSEISYPSRYDLRDENGVTAVRDQARAGSCWAHASIASLESYLLYNRSETWDFSENNEKNVLAYSYQNGFDRDADGGGNALLASAYFTRWDGPVLESDDPYNDLSGASPSNIPVSKHVQEVLFIPMRQSELDNDEIKFALQQYGAVHVSMSWYEDAYNSSFSSYYYNGSSSGGGHAVTIVGWDDNYDRNNFTSVASGDGAFIVKNSWGDSWGDDGYFYVSYNDAKFGRRTISAVFTAENVSNYDRIYQYDELGWITSYGFYNTTGYGANIFTALTNETLEGVSFYTTNSNSFYNISVYLDPVSGPINSSGPVSVQNGTIAMAGYHTIDLDTNVSLNNGQNFSVVVRFTTPTYNYPLPIEYPISGYSSNAHAEAGESYVSYNGTGWEDISESDANVCIKAFTKENKEPKASFVAGTRYVHVNETVDFHDTSLFSPESWEWDFGDSSTTSVQNPLHSYSDAGVYNVSLNASNAYGSNISVRTSFIHVLDSTIVVNSSGSADFSTITEAINAASDGDTILVEPGTYNENLYFKNDNISLVSSTGNPEDIRIVSSSSSSVVIYIKADYITVSGISTENGSMGIVVDSSSRCNISNCYSSGNAYGIYFYNSRDNSIYNCTSYENSYGLRLRGSVNNILNNNSMNNNTFNSYFDSNANIVEKSNLVDGKQIYYLLNSSDQVINASSNAGLVYLLNCSNITVENLKILNNYYGFYLYDSNNVIIDNSTSTDNRYGAYFSSSDNNRIYSCNISGISIYGLSLVECSDNLIYNNYFNNSNNVYVSGGGSNHWNITRTAGTNIINGSYLGGNYWAKPDGTGWSQTEYSVGNGFCAAYDIKEDGKNTDYLPLTQNNVQPSVSDAASSQESNDDGIHVRMATTTSSPSNIVATDSSVRFVGRGAEVEYVFTDGSTPVNEISFESETNDGYVMASVSLLDELPESSPAPSSVAVYQGMEIILGDDEFSSGIGDAKISFSVSKEWLESNDFGEGDIHMEHFSNGAWNKLPTVVIGEDAEYFYFEATTTGFSPFMICADTNNGVVSNEVQTPDSITMATSSGVAEKEENIQSITKDNEKNSGTTIFVLLAFILIGVIGLMYGKKGSKGKI
ncbi:lectin like domain-containing protein [Methanolobus bombayensis]|uniref:lectin like domain-containing protein n=1 Tax=Methanolobus bombayensis TaxID=38023 RepID=UPI001AE712B6|nr:lectin like domain-containing protein [Methanolobus bombayensis]MBP1910713.1 PGF-pre-PGF domain-containing protein [Methanolobus bombayensis]